ncbi:ABC transporter permease [Sulfuriferula nivalis]|uniref:Transport permease protein n=1 Tax=Sulfuriferula nivalis TaxID=2675298 RepID=A0A809RGB9_9PROT|nr:ABC transporter permease [Sulfuriferula nivalis]BBP00909.1 antibiotic ABC transporter permease [Sulfuriferula nivalis]
MFKRIFALMIKEFQALLKDKRSRFVLIIPPLVQLMVFGYAATFDLKHVPYAVFNEDTGAISRDMIAAFHGSPSFHETMQINHNSEIAPLLDSKGALLIIHIGPRFSADMLSGRPAPVQFLVDGRNSNTALLIVNYAQEIVNRFNNDWVTNNGGAPPAHIVTRAWFNPNLESRWFFLPGIVGLLTLLVTILVTALSVAREREQGTFDQLLVTPLHPAEILIGKALPGFLIGIVEASLIVLVTVLWFKVPLLGSLLTLYTGVLLFLLSAVGIGLMISSLAVTQQQGMLGAFFFMVPAIILSGFATPIRNMPQLVQYLTLLNPMRYFLVVLRGVFLEGTPFHLLIPQLWPLALIGLVTLVIAGWLFRHRMY